MTDSLLNRLRERLVIAVIRAPDGDSACRAVAALVAGGVTAVEITYTTPGADQVIARLREEYGAEVVVGAGTLTTEEQVSRSTSAGAEFLVTPGVEPRLAAAMQRSGVPFALGAITPSEVMAALAFDPDLVKIFPGSLGGPGHLRALRGPFPDVRFMPTGGVSLDNAGAWLDAGAVCLGAGGDLVPGRMLETGDYAGITARAEAFNAVLEPWR
jgi:2-dehydro-3-deoxyphosphogluconate aldolase/(4S)-4-hydroxy-2-oxoglutarate aldolase